MTVIVIEEERGFHDEAPCALCGGGLKVPFVVYNHNKAVACFCSDCCTTLRRGLMADMVQVAAIVELGDRGSTLVRHGVAELKRAGVGVSPDMPFASSVVRMPRKA
jgi:hypothetical protein